MIHDRAMVNGVRLHFVREGTRGPLVLFLHGFPEFWRMWRAQLADLGRDHRAVAVDMRGYNESARPRDVAAYRMPVLVEDVRALLDHLGAERAVLVGHDWGGLVAWAFAMAHPERVARLVILNAPHPATFVRTLRRHPAQVLASSYVVGFQVPGAERVLAAFDYRALRRAVFATDPRPAAEVEADERTYVAAWSQPGALWAGLAYYRAAVRAMLRHGRQALPADLVVRAPTLVLWGERDPFLLDANLDGLERYVPSLTLRRVPDATHWIVREKPELVSAEIRRFVAGA